MTNNFNNNKNYKIHLIQISIKMSVNKIEINNNLTYKSIKSGVNKIKRRIRRNKRIKIKLKFKISKKNIKIFISLKNDKANNQSMNT